MSDGMKSGMIQAKDLQVSGMTSIVPSCRDLWTLLPAVIGELV